MFEKFQKKLTIQSENSALNKFIRIGGRSDFSDIEAKELYFVDKTNLISHVLNSPSNVIL
jgi:hypothetical protein